MKIDNILNEQVREILSEESIQAIEKAFEDKIKLQVEAALTKQDDLYSSKLVQLMEAIDKDHTNKLKSVVNAIDADNAKKLKKVINKYEYTLNTEAKSFKDNLVTSISDYLEEFLEESIPTEAINEATKNRSAMEVLSNLRRVLAVDSALMSESVQDAVIDGKQQIDSLTERVKVLEQENTTIKESYKKVKSELLLETLTSELPQSKKEFMKKVLGDKSPTFIKENFEYTLRLFDKKEKERLEMIKEQAFTNRKVKADAPTTVVESTNTPKSVVNPYLDELKKVK